MDSATVGMIVLGVIGFGILVLMVYVVYVVADAAHEAARFFRMKNAEMLDDFEDDE